MRVRRGIGSRLLPCGCLAGIYETYSNRIVVLLDARHTDCTDPTHVDGKRLPASLLDGNPVKPT